MESWIFESFSEAETESLGAQLASVLEPNVVVGLIGDLGAGKTRLVRAISTAMGADPKAVTSPTFVLIHEYDARWPIYHIDTYRLRDSDEFLELGVEELLESGGVCLIEWADRVADVLPSDMLWIQIAVTGEATRRFFCSETGSRSNALLQRLKHRPEAETAIG